MAVSVNYQDFLGDILKTVTQPETLRSLLEAVAHGQVTPEMALESLKDLAYESVGDFAKIDHHRQLRTGFPEVIWGMGKTPSQIAQIMEVMRHRSETVMATRIEISVYEILQKQVRGLQYYELARICAIAPPVIEIRFPGQIGIISAGTADLPTAEEAAVTLNLLVFQSNDFGM